MAGVPIVFALLAAFCNALNVVTQHRASIGDPGHSKGWRFVRYLVSNPLWLFGWVALAASFVFQALALHNGLLSVVQPLLVTELVFALVLRRVWIRQSIHARHMVGCGTHLYLPRSVRLGIRTERGQCHPDEQRVAGCHRGHSRRSRDPLRDLVRRLTGTSCRASGGGDRHPVGTGRHLHQGDDRFAHAVRRRRHVLALARVRAGGGGPRCGAR